MQVALITVGEELLSGDVVNTNANWLATQLTERGVTVERILTVRDVQPIIADRVSAFGREHDRVIVTGGIGGTPDDVTMEAVASAFDREMVVPDITLASVERRLENIAQRRPDLELDVDVEGEAAVPAGSRPLINEEGLAPGCVIENVYVLPGIPDEMKAMFAGIASEFNGQLQSAFYYTVEPESNITCALEEAMNRFDVSVGCYPDRDAGHNRLKLTGTAEDELADAGEWLLSTINASETPVSREDDRE